MKITLNTTLYGLLMLSGLSVVQSAVMSIDFGTEWIKIGLVKPSVPFDIVLNRDSKRKTQAVLTIRGTERTFSVNGQALGIRFPKDSFYDLKLILGQHFDSKQSNQYRSTHWNRISKADNKNVTLFTSDNGSKYLAEELTAMLFQYAREEAEITAGEKIKDVVITIPPYFNQYERQAILDAAEIAELKVLSLVSDGSAVALNYAMTRKFASGPQKHIIYDIGSGNSVATLVNIKETTAKEGKYKRNVTYTSIDVLGVGYDKELGGKYFDSKIQKLLIERFTSNNPSLSTPITESPRALAKLLKDSTKMKQILSANNDASLSIESLYEDVDFKSKITREEFEKASEDLFERVLNPIKDILDSSKLTIDQIDSIILVGGGVRIPKIQAALVKFAGEKKISQSVNGDESAAIGATFRGASLSSQFKVKDIRLKEANTYPIEAVIIPVNKDVGEKTTVSIINSNQAAFEHKFMPIKFNSDFDFTLQYPENLTSIKEEYGCHQLGEATVRGIDENLKKLKDRIVGEPKVRVLVSISTAGIISTPKAQLVLQLTPLEKPSETPESVTNTEDAKESANATETNKEDSKKTVIEKIQLELKYTPTCFLPMNKQEIKEASNKLAELNRIDKERYARDEALNSLESFIYSNDYFIESEEIVEITTSEEREKLEKAVISASEWLLENSDATKNEFAKKLKELQTIKIPIELRRKEIDNRPKAIESLEETLNSVEVYVDKLVQNLTVEHKEILAPVYKEIQDEASAAKLWLKEKVEQQAKLASYQEPILLSKDIESRHKKLDDLKFKLVAKIVSLPKPQESSNASKDKDDSTVHTSNTEKTESENEHEPSTKSNKEDAESKPVESDKKESAKDEKDEL
ncbi:actin-like ATPase domain-containing protein [Neoconidiobolus thromboides FSU 785]|nr:actin-like ATPase domain-containing protein [Neoconidiobolus thromboides FSU 785]